MDKAVQATVGCTNPEIATPISFKGWNDVAGESILDGVSSKLSVFEPLKTARCANPEFPVPVLVDCIYGRRGQSVFHRVKRKLLVFEPV